MGLEGINKKRGEYQGNFKNQKSLSTFISSK